MAAEAAELYLRRGPDWLHYRFDDDGLRLTTTDSPGSLERLAIGGQKGC